ncbi:MAG TPA: sugar phosphate isomerase/epimerase family protein [Jatrophihabitantaceae bacterium]|nr:sugar phosphate isomerase/epimerase family protein [Jatrophihabitantaceae bacterium]
MSDRRQAAMANRLGVHSLVWAGTWSVEDARRAVTLTRAAGFDVLELALSDPACIDTAATRALLTEFNIAATGSLALPMEYDVSSEDLDAVRRGEGLLLAALTTMHALGADSLYGVLYSALGKYAQPCTSAGRRNAVGVVRSVADAAAERDMRLGLEVVNRYETNVFNTVADALRFVDEVGRDNVRLHLDTYHMNIEERGLADPVRTAGDRIGYVHVGESHRGYLGTGTVDFDAFFGALAGVGYNGDITFESFSSAVVEPRLSSTLAVWRNLWDDAEDLARHARAFIGDRIAAAQVLAS